MIKSDFSEFAKIIKEFITLFDELIPIEQEKLDAAVKNRVTFVEECMHKEQAAVLRLRGLEQKREKEQTELGMENYRFRQILEEIPEETASIFRPLFEQLSQQVQTLQSLNESTRDSIEVNLHVIQSSLAADHTGRDTYSASGKRNAPDNKKHFTSRKV